MIYFSIVIPTYNRAHLLKPTIDSVLSQAFEGFELIIVDDGSKDNTREVLSQAYGQDQRFRYFYKENGERGAARNYGLKQAKGKYVVFLDSDDLFKPGHLQVLYQAAEANGQPKFLAARHEIQRGDHFGKGALEHMQEGFQPYEVVLKGNPFSCNFAVLRENPDLILFREEREFVIIEDWVFLVENLRNSPLYLDGAYSSILVDHDARSMRGDQRNVINKRLFALDWLVKKYSFSPAELKMIKGFSYYFCAIHYYIERSRSEALAMWNKARKELGPTKALLVLLPKILAGQKLITRITGR